MSNSPQNALHVLMVRPAAFGFNPETADTNSFQKEDSALDAAGVQSRALGEFDAAVDRLRDCGAEVLVFDDTPTPRKTDAVFPNNWISTHAGGLVITWPLMSASRREEVRTDIIDELKRRFIVREQWELHRLTGEGRFLEGTGSLVLDRANRVAYACQSPRTDAGLVEEFCKRLRFSPVRFSAVDRAGQPIYHTNVMMAVLRREAIVCLESIVDRDERGRVLDAFESSGHSIIDISHQQMEGFAANVLQIGRADGGPLLVLSTTTARALTPGQRRRLSRDSELVEQDIPTIERHGGGGVRCMLAEIFLEPNSVTCNGK